MANRTDYIAIIKSDEYKNKLKKMAQDIKNASKVAPNEATIESRFDCELFAFFKDMFEPLGFIYNPIKEKSINTARHISKGRADTAIASLVIEFKQPSTLSNKINKAKAISQISDYLLGLKSEDNKIVEGYVTNGVEGCFVTLVNGEIHEEDFIEINEFALDRIIQNILSLKLLAFNASNLVDSFCNPPENNGVAYELVRCLYNVLIEDIKPKTKMLFIEWKQLFNLAHDDISKQQAIIDRKKSLEELLGHKFSDRDDEYLSLYALQTAYAIIVKAIAFKVVSQVRFNKSLISFGESINQDSEALRIQFSRLEDGAIFRDYGMTNLLEGDFFSWYCAENQWNESIAKCIKNIFEILSRYSEKAVLNNTHKSQDFFKRLPGTRECTCLRNMQNSKSKYKMPVTDILLETKYLHPMIKGKDVTPFHVEWNNYIVPFPYEVENPRVPIEMGRLSSLAPKLAEYYNKNKKMILSQTEYNEKIIGNRDADFYALARVGEYSYATNYVVFRDNTKWAAAVISEVNTQWGGVKRPLFQNHAVSICEDEDGNFITLDEAHYICGILNSNYVYEYMMNSSDSRSFPIRPRVKIPKYDKTNKRHKEISDLSKLAHERYQNQMEISKIKSQIDLLYMQIL